MPDQSEKKGFFRRMLDAYNQFCNEMEVDKGTCRGCVPIVKFDEDAKQETDNEAGKAS
ncbi:DUF5363 domain-containing protein [Histophilus somni]|uniref:DUF5363 domain-containing protein n=1 Tax=Histophilus somni TaxID=731 RepID=A0A9Q6Z107_HISSO|nr:DUF5363 domain-containing protein [Histophilus somni]MBB5151230.1 hypothetical protein [Histophilus somni]QQF77378.1 DUF5363 domain-containing protein [Histophilus somni]QQF82051.1 DUF5363 domain-containing protein [Histophilus somni]QQF91343.1 DUF5363 domain-containing protein [Histophilus somni]